jgi:hypothetical protein
MNRNPQFTAASAFGALALVLCVASPTGDLESVLVAVGAAVICLICLAIAVRRSWSPGGVGCLLLLGLPAILIGYELLIGPLVNPLRRSNEAIEQSFLERHPLGSPRADVQAWADAKGFRMDFKEFGKQEHWLLRHLDTYWTFGSWVEVYAEWEFGPDDRLISVKVKKIVNVL